MGLYLQHKAQKLVSHVTKIRSCALLHLQTVKNTQTVGLDPEKYRQTELLFNLIESTGV